MEKIELRNRVTPGWLVILAAKLGIGLLVSGAGLIGLLRGNFSGATWTALAMGAAVAGAGLFDLRLLSDRGVKITLTPEGLLDHRMRNPLLLPWARVTSIFHDSTDGHSLHVAVSGLDVSRFTGPGTAKSLLSSTKLTVQLDYVDVSFDGLERLVHQVAPDVVFSSLTRRPHNARGRVE